MIIIAIIHILSWILAAICNAAMDILQFHYSESIFDNEFDHYWDPSVSWKNKWKNDRKSEGPKYFGSTTVFVFLTDGWHMLNFVMNLLITVTIVTGILLGGAEMRWYQYVIMFVGYRLVWGMVFETFFSKVFKR